MNQCMILFDDGCGCVLPMTWARDCAGAVNVASDTEPVIAFQDRKAARKALRISRLWAELQKEQGRPCCEEFLGKMPQIRIHAVIVVPTEPKKEGA